MITYRVSPNTKPVYPTSGNQEVLPTVKKMLFFATSDEYTDVVKKYSNKTEIFTLTSAPSQKCLMRANSVVEYEGGIKVNDISQIENFLENLSIYANCDKKPQYHWDKLKNSYVPYTSKYHLEHNYKKAELDDQDKLFLVNKYNFPATVSSCDKNFDLCSVGANLSEEMINNSTFKDKDIKGRHIQLIYKNTDNGGYLKFKKSDNSLQNNLSQPSVPDEISEYSEHDAICVNVHFIKGANSGFDTQLENIGKNFGYVIKSHNQVPRIEGYNNKSIAERFQQLRKDFEKLVSFASQDYDSCNSLVEHTKNSFSGCSIKVGKRIIQEPKYIKGGKGKYTLEIGQYKVIFDNGNSAQDFESLSIYNIKLFAPPNLNDILLGTNPVDNPAVAKDNEILDESTASSPTDNKNNDDLATPAESTMTLADTGSSIDELGGALLLAELSLNEQKISNNDVDP
jgi:hypothetical protein